MRSHLLLPLVAILMGMTPVGPTFSDVSWDHPNIDAIRYLAGIEIVSGYPDGTYRPDQDINRAEFTKIAVGAMFTEQAWTKCDPNNIYSFHDASRAEWYSPFLCVAVQNQVIQGYADGTFRPTQNISFVEAAKILVQSDRENAAGNPQYDRSLPTMNGPWYQPYVQYLQNRNAIPMSITHFDQLITRGEMAEMIYRLKAGVTDRHSKTYDDLAGNSSTQTSGSMQTYIDPQNRYSMTFPSDWTVVKRIDDDTVTFTKPIDPVYTFIGDAHIDVSVSQTCSVTYFSNGVVQTVSLGGHDFTATEGNDGAAGTQYYAIIFTSQINTSECLTLRKVIGVSDVMQETDADRQAAAQQLDAMREQLKNVLKTLKVY